MQRSFLGGQRKSNWASQVTLTFKICTLFNTSEAGKCSDDAQDSISPQSFRYFEKFNGSQELVLLKLAHFTLGELLTNDFILKNLFGLVTKECV
jgi:hypothetical protein